MKYDPSTRALRFASDQELDRFHAEVTALLRDAVSEASRHGDAQAGRVAAQSVFRDFACVLRTLNALRPHLERTVGAHDPPPSEPEAGGTDGEP